MKEQQSAIKIHQGEALERISERYPKVMDAVLEYIQNAIDANASKIWVSINQTNCAATIRDNGDGISVNGFDNALQSILKSQKTKGKLGQFGMGMLSGVGKCKIFTITTSPKNENNYVRWIFNTNELVKQEAIEGIPYQLMPQLNYSNKNIGKQGKVNFVNWRTEVFLSGLTKDRVVGRITLEELKMLIIEKYNEALKIHDTVVYINLKNEKGGSEHAEVKAVKFTGEKLSLITSDSPDCGKSYFDLYIARKQAGLRKGKVAIGVANDMFRINIKNFAEHHRELVSQETVDVICSGVFEGYITCEKIKLDTSRKHFIENDALLSFAMEIEKWSKETGKEMLTSLDDNSSDELYQLSGLKAMMTIEEVIKNNSELLELIKSSKVGTTGDNHYLDPKKEKGITTETFLSTQGGTTEKKPSADRKPPEIFTLLPKTPKVDHPEHTPFVVSGTQGKTRKVVSGHSTGLRFVFSEMPGSQELWEYNKKNGCLAFNVRHPLWAEAEKKALLLARFIEVISIKALTLELMPGSFRDGAKEFIKNELPITLTLLKNMIPKTGGLGRISKKSLVI